MPTQLAPGTYGKIGSTELADGQWKARVRYRDYDGVTRLVSRTADTEGAAVKRLKSALVTRAAPAGVGITDRTRLSALADAWLDAPHDWSTGTRQLYGYVVKNQIKPAVGGLTVAEVKPATIGRALAAIQKRHGGPIAKTARACLSGMFGYAIEHEACSHNPVRDTSVRITVTPKRPRALTVEQQDELCDWLRTDQRSVDLDLPDLVDFMLATGCRIGEACAARYLPNSDGQPLLDLDAGTWEINATTVRISGKGLVIQHKPKSKAGWRIIKLPPFAIDMLRGRQTQLRLRAPIPVVFPAPLARSLRDPNNTSGDLREALDRAGFDWATAHTFRKTAITRLLDAGVPPQEVSMFAGHAQTSMTLNTYAGRPVASLAAAVILDRGSSTPDNGTDVATT